MASPNFNWLELGDPPEPMRPGYRRLATYLELIRAAVGHVPIAVTSGYRTEARNREIGGAPFSQHVFGVAADFRVTRGPFADPRLLYHLVSGLININAIPDGGLGSYPTHVHYDLRADQTRWMR